MKSSTKMSWNMGEIEYMENKNHMWNQCYEWIDQMNEIKLHHLDENKAFGSNWWHLWSYQHGSIWNYNDIWKHKACGCQ